MTRGRRSRPSFRPNLVCLESRDTPTAVGALDPRFDTDGRVQVSLAGSSFQDVAVEPNGDVVAVTSVPTGVGTNRDILIARFLPNGAPDTTFGTNGQVRAGFTNAAASAVAVQADGTIVAAGASFPGVGVDTALARVSADGATVTRTTQAVGGAGVNDSADGVAVNPTTGDVYVSVSSSTGGAVARFLSNLTFVTSVALPITAFATTDVAAAPDGRVFVVGASTAGANQVAVSRLNADLTGLTSNTTIPAATANAIAVDPAADRVYLAGNNSGVVLGLPQVIQLNKDLGEVDRTTIDFGRTSALNDVAVDSRGRVVVAGTFGQEFGSTTGDFAVARLLPTALALDTSFDGDGKQTVNVAGNDSGQAVAVGPGDTVVVAGGATANPTSPGAQVDPALVRLVGSVELPSQLLAGGATNGTGELSTLPAPTATRTAQTTFQTPGTSQTLIPGLDKNVRTATADVNGDGVPDLIAVTGAGTANRVRVIDGKTQAVIADFAPFETSFSGGLYVAAGDLDGDGKAEVLVTPDQTGGPVVAVYSGAKLTAGQGTGTFGQGAQIVRFFGIDDPNFRGGARAAVGDVNGDGVPDVVVSAGFLGGPRIAVFNGKDVAAGNGSPNRLTPDFFAFEESVRNGAFVAVGDVDGDGFADLVFGGGPTGGPRVRIASGKALLSAPITSLDTATTPGLQLANFIVGDPNSRGGVRLATKDVDGDNLADVIAGSGDNLAASAVLFRGATLKANGNGPTPDQTLTPFGGGVLANGVFVG